MAATLWYHDHAMGITRLNVALGLAGFYVLDDPPATASLGLPSGAYDLPLMIMDRTFDAAGSIVLPPQWQQHTFGESFPPCCCRLDARRAMTQACRFW